MKIEEVKAGILVFVSSLIEKEVDGIRRRKGALGMVDSPVLGTGGLWWWITHEDGTQIRYRYCEISEMKTIKISNSEIIEKGDRSDEESISDDIAGGNKDEFSSDAREYRGDDLAQQWIYETIEKWID